MSPVWIPVFVAAIGAASLLASNRLNARTTSTTSLDARAQSILDKALEYAEREIGALRGRVESLEHEVEQCEAGRAEDRQSFARQVAELRTELRERDRP